LRSGDGTKEVERVEKEFSLDYTDFSNKIAQIPPQGIRISEERVMSQLGKRYRCSVCGTEILCTKAGEGVAVCCDKDMEVQEPKPLPSSD